jgi:hypothetical protein
MPSNFEGLTDNVMSWFHPTGANSTDANMNEPSFQWILCKAISAREIKCRRGVKHRNFNAK